MMVKGATFRKPLTLAVTAASLLLVASCGAGAAARVAPRLTNNVSGSAHAQDGHKNATVQESHQGNAVEEGQNIKQRSSSHALGQWRSYSTFKPTAPKLLLATSAIAAVMSMLLRGRHFTSRTEEDGKEELLQSTVTPAAGLSSSFPLSNKVLLGLLGLLVVASSLAAPSSGPEGRTGETAEGPAATDRPYVNVFYFCEKTTEKTCDILLPPTRRVSKEFTRNTKAGDEIVFSVRMCTEFEEGLKEGEDSKAQRFLDEVLKLVSSKVENFDGSIERTKPPNFVGPDIVEGPHGSELMHFPEGLRTFDLTAPADNAEARNKGDPNSELLSKKVRYDCMIGPKGPFCRVDLPLANRIWKTVTPKGLPNEIKVNVEMTTDFHNYLSKSGEHDPAHRFLNHLVNEVVTKWSPVGVSDLELENRLPGLSRGVVGNLQEKLPEGLELKDLGSTIRSWMERRVTIYG